MVTYDNDMQEDSQRALDEDCSLVEHRYLLA